MSHERTVSLDDPAVVAAMRAIHDGDVGALQALLVDHPWLARARITRRRGTITLLHVVADWPGHVPNGAGSVRAIIAAGADPDARGAGPNPETPLHWAASSDDVAVLDALLDAGADIDVAGAVIGGGTALSDATAFGQWNAARRLVARGATAGLWEAATMGMVDRLRELLADGPEAEHVTGAFWGACHGGQLATAQILLGHGADHRWIGWDDLTPLGAATRAGAGDVVAWLESLPA